MNNEQSGKRSSAAVDYTSCYKECALPVLSTSDEPLPQETQQTARKLISPILGRQAKILLALLVLCFAYGADQWTKHIVETTMKLGQRVTVIEGVMWWHYILNPGAAFSIGEEYTWVFTIVMALAVLVALFYLLKARSAYWIFTLSLLAGGVLGNLTDRLFRAPGFGIGHVVDYISIGSFAIFNIADSCICVAMALLVILVFCGVNLDGSREKPKAEEEEK